MSAVPRPPGLVRALLRLRLLGPRRLEVEADLGDIFRTRVAALGVRQARRRFYADVLSLWWRRRPGASATGQTGRGPLLQGWGGDVVFAIRLCRRHPVLMAMAVAGLGVGIGISTAAARPSPSLVRDRLKEELEWPHTVAARWSAPSAPSRWVSP